MGIRRVRRNWYMVLGVFVAVFAFAFLAQKFDGDEVEAANFGAFDPGYIISDYQMTNYTSMNEGQIQSFLKSKNGCNNTATWQTGNNIDHYREATPYSWHVAGGHYVCMADENINGESAAHIIWQAAQDYRINPKVLIVLLQKEQQLVEDSLPNSVQYRSATGYGCPDTAACSSQYYGFKNQVRKAAALFREVMDGGWSNYPVGWNYVRYAPGDCGGSNVNIRNRATSALYRYTPYQPNSAALSVPMGQTVYCGAYGNKNFYGLFEDWFGGVTFDGNFNKVNYSDVKQVNIENGTYNILAATSGPKAMSVDGVADGSNVRTASLNDSTDQQWQVEKVDNYYLIRNKKTGKVLDVANGVLSSLINVWQYGENRSCAQRWIFGEESGGTVVIHNACDPSYVLDLQDGKSNIQIYNKSWNRNTNQSWALRKANNRDYSGVYNIIASGDNGKTLSADGMMDGNNVQTSTSSGAALQQWQVEKVNNYYMIRNVGSGEVLDIASGKFANNANVWQYGGHGGCAQRWIFDENTNGTVTVRNACYPGLVLDLQDGKSNLQIYGKTTWNNSNQNWVLRATTAKDYSGIYNIMASGDNGKALGVGGMADGSNVSLSAFSDTNAMQQWKIIKSGYYYLIENVATGKVLDIANGKFANNTNMWQYGKHGGCAQRWMINENNNGTVTIHNSCYSRLVLDLQDGKSNLQVYGKTTWNNSNQNWVLKRTTLMEVGDYSGTYEIISAADNNKTLTAVNNRDGGNVQASVSTDSKWRVEKVNDYYLIKNANNGKVLDIANGNLANNTNVWQYAENRSCAQRWVFWRNTDETVTIYNACNRNYVLDLQDGRSNVQIYFETAYINKNQRWILK